MSSKKTKNRTNVSTKKNIAKSDETKQNKEKYANLDEAQILEIKEAHLVKPSNDEEEKKVEKPDTFLRRVGKSLGFFWDYYKWFVIIPAIVIIMGSIFLTEWINEKKEKTLEVAVVNTYDITDLMNAIEVRYPNERGLDVSEKRISVEYNLQYPKSSINETTIDDIAVASMQKFTAMITAGRVDAAILSTWALDAYAETEAAMDLREVFDGEFLEANKDRIYYYTMSNGTTYPVGLYVGDCNFLGEFDSGEPPVIATFDSAPHPEQALDFIGWVLENCDEEK